jgi:hypothetical protein
VLTRPRASQDGIGLALSAVWVPDRVVNVANEQADTGRRHQAAGRTDLVQSQLDVLTSADPRVLLGAVTRPMARRVPGVALSGTLG